MKLASLKGGRDGRLVVVSRDLSRCADASAVAPTLQAALDEWDAALPRLTELSRLARSRTPRTSAVRSGQMRRAVAARLSMGGRIGLRQSRGTGAQGPRRRGAGIVLDRSADVSGRLRHLLGPRDPVALADEAWGIDIEAEVVVILGDVPMGASREQAARAVRLIMLVNDVTLRNLTGPELAKGFGFLQIEAVFGLHAGCGHARRARQGVGRGQGRSAA